MSSFLRIETLLGGGLVIVDNALPDDAFARIAKFGVDEHLHWPDTIDAAQIWHRNGELNPSISAAFVWADDETYSEHIKYIAGIQPYPSGKPIDLLIDLVRRYAMQVCATADQTWVGGIASVFCYGLGSSLVWHSDDRHYVGAFAYYIHEKWEPGWGGALICRSGRTASGGESELRVEPRPNRLVFIRSGTPHCIERVNCPPPHNRLSVAGFLVGVRGADALLERLLDSPTFQ